MNSPTNLSSKSTQEPCLFSLWITDDNYAIADYFFSVLAVIVNMLTCPFVVVLNVVVIQVVRTKPRLQNMHNILLACLSGTDLLMGLVCQPAFIAQQFFRIWRGESLPLLCLFTNITNTVTAGLFIASLSHLMLISFERFVAMKYGLRYSTIVTTFRIGVAIACCWLLVVAYVVSIFVTAPRLIPWPLIYVIVSLLVIIFCHISVYLVSRRHLIQIVSQQVLPEAKAKFLAENKACKTTSIIIGGLFCLICLDCC